MVKHSQARPKITHHIAYICNEKKKKKVKNNIVIIVSIAETSVKRSPLLFFFPEGYL